MHKRSGLAKAEASNFWVTPKCLSLWFLKTKIRMARLVQGCAKRAHVTFEFKIPSA